MTGSSKRCFILPGIALILVLLAACNQPGVASNPSGASATPTLAPQHGSPLLLELASSSGSFQPPALICDVWYYPDGVEGFPSLIFYEDGSVDYDTFAEVCMGTYTVDQTRITVTLEIEEEFEDPDEDDYWIETYSVVVLLHSEDPFLLRESSYGDVYALEGYYNLVLEAFEYYYLDGDPESFSIWFWDDDEVDIDYPDGEGESGYYTIQGNRIFIELEDGELYLEIVNGYTLKTPQGRTFLREGY